MKHTRRILRYFCYPALAACVFIAFSLWLYSHAPVEDLRGSFAYHPPHSSTPRDIGLGATNTISFSMLPSDLELALVLAEDDRFFTHHGVDPKNIGESIQEFLFDDKPLRGGSTITQQLVKNAFLSTKRSFTRKYIEMIYALKIERHFTKEEILSLYASMAETAPGAYGMSEGARYYFNKPLPELSQAQTIFLACILRAPEQTATMLRTHGDVSVLQRRLESILLRVLIIDYAFDFARAQSAPNALAEPSSVEWYKSVQQKNITIYQASNGGVTSHERQCLIAQSTHQIYDLLTQSFGFTLHPPAVSIAKACAAPSWAD